ncbi:heavy metal translocating P-type ATPase [Crossiella sp. CA-258035]|uniref:heavy metal translocating P-type ATPase n=1 Tax=Crossiella sp. CA-258035 TaxID=2981138 RepID=UPI0024BC84FE|nr:heavy metal translocating P-type ATPase [Crossiella sp. CA-258035]WHT16189.1 heavy metal translocating P-type ATPase [Crossiella sp. CA-258035]
MASALAAPPTTATAPRPARAALLALPEARWAAAALALFLTALATQLLGGPSWLWWSLYLACYAAGGWEPGLSGLRALREKTLDVDLLMVVAAIGAAAIGQVMDGGLLIVIFATSGALEAFATARTEASVRDLLDLAPETANRVTGDREQTVPVTELAVGDTVFVRPGERVPADGEVVSGASEVDQATITGEGTPTTKLVGDEVFAGTLNGTGALTVRVARRAEDSVVARIAGLVDQASRTKAGTQLFIERVEQRYSVAMVAATLALFAIPLTWGAGLQESLLRAMTFMIVASPCALVLATMPPLLAAIANAGRHGVLVKSAVVLEGLGATTLVAFDKTGTLTTGAPGLSTVRPLTEITENELLRLAAAAEVPSEHPLGAAIVQAARARGLELPAATEFVAEPGRGVRATVAGARVTVGAPVPDLAVELRQRGETAVAVRVDGELIGVLGLTDRPRAEAVHAVLATARLTGHPPVLLTGDNDLTAAQLARRVGIEDVRAGLLPQDKATEVQALIAAGHRVAMVGDGINDAPALATAHTGIAMGGAGADLTLQTADAVVVRDDLTAIPATLALARRARRVVRANLAIAGVCIAGLVIWDLAGTLPLPLGVAGHEGSTVLVALNGLRLLRRSAWQRAANEAGGHRGGTV